MAFFVAPGEKIRSDSALPALPDKTTFGYTQVEVLVLAVMPPLNPAG